MEREKVVEGEGCKKGVEGRLTLWPSHRRRQRQSVFQVGWGGTVIVGS